MNRTVKQTFFFLIAGILAICVGIFFVVKQNAQIQRDTEPAVGTVVGYNEGEISDSDGGSDTVYYPIVSYQVGDETLESQATDYEYDKIYEIGETVNIKYDPSNPSEFIYEGTKAVNFSNIWVMGIGGILVIIALVRIIGWVVLSRRN